VMKYIVKPKKITELAFCNCGCKNGTYCTCYSGATYVVNK